MPTVLEQLQDPGTRLLFDRVVKGEAGDSPDDMRDVIGTIFNRARMSGQPLRDVLLAKGQFTSVSDFPGNARDKLGGMGMDALSTQNAALDQALQQFDPQAGTIKGFDPNVVDFYQPAAQAQYHKEHPEAYQEMPSYARGKKPTYTGKSGQEYFEGTYKGGLPEVQDLAQPQAGGQPGQPPGMQMPQLSAADQAIVDANDAKRHALVGEQMANYDKQNDLIEEEIKGLTETQRAADGFHDRYQASMKTIIDGLPDEHKMEMEELRKVSPDEPGNPTRALKQFLPMLVMMGGMFARGGGIGAMNAAAAAVNAARSHDETALKKAHQDFQDQLTEALDKSSMAHEMLADGLAKAQGDQNEILQVANLVGTQLGIPALKIAALDGDTNAIYAHFATLSKAVGDGLNWQLRTQKLQMDQLKYQQALNLANAGKDLTDAEIWSLATGFNNGIRPAPSFGLGQNEARNKFNSYIGLQSMHQDWQGPWGYGPDPTGASDKPPVPGGQTTPTGGGPATPGLSPTEAGEHQAEKHTLLKVDAQNLGNASKVLTALDPFARTMIDIAKMSEDAAHGGLAGTPSPLLNRGIQWIRTVPTSDPQVLRLRTLINTLGQEYGKISSSSTGSVREVSTTYADRIHEILNTDMPVKTFFAVVETMLQETRARQKEQMQEVTDTKQAYERHLKGDTSDAVDQPAGAPPANDPLGIR